MMKRLVSILVSGAFALSLGVLAIAQTQTPSINNREHRQQKRIKQGVNNGSLTKKEAARMEKQQAKTHRIEAKAKSDGKVTAKERARIQARENKTSRHIYKQKHDAQKRN
ncbi:MAG TPA: hypothetical protein VFB82_10325 [Blastocatellia bacterium]|nr:hypothetical protein [Blastocatellia bacterium]